MKRKLSINSFQIAKAVASDCEKMFPLLAILIVLFSYILWMRRGLYRLSWQLPGPFAFPIIGNALSAHPNQLLAYFDRITKIYESPIRLWFGPVMVVLIADAKNVEIVMKSKDCYSKPEEFYKMIRDGLGADGLITLKAEEWQIHRRLVGPTINQQILASHIPIFIGHIRETVSSLPTNGEFFDILPFVTKCNLTMFVEASLGTELEPKLKQRMLELLPACISLIAKRSLTPLYHLDFIWNRTKTAKIMKGYTKESEAIFAHIIQGKIKNNDTSGSFLGKLMDVSKSNPKFTIRDIYAETATLIVGSSDTSSIASSFVALMLALHPEYQERVFQEVYALMPDKNTNISHADLEKMTFTELCMRETWRLFPTSPLIGRVAEQPIKLSNNVVVPPGVPIIFGIRQVHLQEKYYGPTAHIFNPNRFLDEDIKNLPDSAYVAFAYGPRRCLGYIYAQTVVKCFIAHLIRNYRLTTSYTSIDQLRVTHNITLKLLDKHMIKVEPRGV